MSTEPKTKAPRAQAVDREPPGHAVAVAWLEQAKARARDGSRLQQPQAPRETSQFRPRSSRPPASHPPLGDTTPAPSTFPPPQLERSSSRPPVGRDGTKRTSRARRARERTKARSEAHYRKTLERWKSVAKERAEKGGLAVDVAVVPLSTWLTCWAIVCDATGAALRAAFKLARNTAAKENALRAALNVTTGGVARYRFSTSTAEGLRSRRIAALAIAMLELAKPTKVRGAYGGGEVLGIPRGAFCELLRDVNDPRRAPKVDWYAVRHCKFCKSRGCAVCKERDPGVPHVNTVFGSHRDGGTAESGEVGYWRALHEAGFGYRRQLPPREAAAVELAFGPYATNRYQICASKPERCAERIREALLARLGLLIALQEGPSALEAELRRLPGIPPPETPPPPRRRWWAPGAAPVDAPV
jgi:hypothetical protein